MEVQAAVARTAYWLLVKRAIKKPIVFLPVLDGGLYFSMLLMRHFVSIGAHYDYETVCVQSYSGSVQTKPVLVKGIQNNWKNHHVVIVDDIYDTGSTFNFIVESLKNDNIFCANMSGVFLLHSADFKNREKSVQCFSELKAKGWMIGCGLDDNGVSRACRDVWVKNGKGVSCER